MERGREVPSGDRSSGTDLWSRMLGVLLHCLFVTLNPMNILFGWFPAIPIMGCLGFKKFILIHCLEVGKLGYSLVVVFFVVRTGFGF